MNDEFIGFCGIKNIDGVLDFGYFLRKSFWGQGFATEACELAVKRLEKEVEFSDVDVFIAQENKASLAVAGKLGWCRLQEASKEGELGYYYRISM